MASSKVYPNSYFNSYFGNRQELLNFLDADCLKNANFAGITVHEFRGEIATVVSYLKRSPSGDEICEYQVLIRDNPYNRGLSDDPLYIPIASNPPGQAGLSAFQIANEAEPTVSNFTITFDDEEVVELSFEPIPLSVFTDTIVTFNSVDALYENLIGLLDDDTTVTGGTGSDGIEVGAGNDTVDGNGGDDFVAKWKSGDLTYDGGEGSDWFSLQAATGAIYREPLIQQFTVDLTTGLGTNPYGGALNFTSVENVIGTNEADVINGNDSGNIIGDGLFDTGADHVNALGGDDTVKITQFSAGGDYDGGDGFDTLFFQYGSGNHTLDLVAPQNNAGMFAGTAIAGFERYEIGRDLVTANGSFSFNGSSEAETVIVQSGAVNADLGGGNDIFILADSFATGPFIVNGGNGASTDTLLFTQGFGVNVLDLESPDNNTGIFNGSTFDDFEVFQVRVVQDSNGNPFSFGTLDFRAGAARPDPVVVFGSARADVISGGSASDYLSGLEGDDLLTGLGGEDIFTLFSLGGTDTITDFTIGEDQLLVLDDGVGLGDVSVQQNGADTIVTVNIPQPAPVAGVAFLSVPDVLAEIVLEDVDAGAFEASLGQSLLFDSQSTAEDDAYLFEQNTPLKVSMDDGVLANDNVGNNPIVQIVSTTSNGDLELNDDGSFLFTPDLDFIGQDSFTYRVTSAEGESLATVALSGPGPITGTPDDDVLDGTSNSDIIQALAGNDIINGSSGNDSIDGDEGDDVVVYNGVRNDFQHDLMADSTVTVVKPGGGTDTVVEVERIEFDDGALLYDVATPNLGFGYRIYQASFDRTPDEGGVLFWIGILDQLDGQGWSQYEKEQFLANQFIQSDEFKALFGANPTNEQYIDAMYLNVLDRLPDQGGYDFWVGGMEQGLTREDILIAFTKSDENVARTAPDLDDGVWVV